MFDLMKIARLGLIAAGALAAWGAWLWQHDSKVIRKEQVRVEEQGKKVDAKAQTARKRAATDADRVLPKYYRD